MVQIDSIIGNKKALEVVLFLAYHSGQTFSYGQLQHKTKLAKATLTKWLHFMTHLNYIICTTIGRNKMYTINKDKAVIKQLKILVNVSQLNSFSGVLHKSGYEVYLFGSAARGEDIETSDIDILLIGKSNREALMDEVRALEKKLHKEIKLQLFTAGEWLRLREKDPAFYERVEKDKILLQ